MRKRHSFGPLGSERRVMNVGESGVSHIDAVARHLPSAIQEVGRLSGYVSL